MSSAGSRGSAWGGLAILSLACMVVVMDATVLHLAVPRLTAALNATPSEILWIVDAYAFLITGSMILMGTIGDRIGRKKLLLLGAAAFAVVSALAALSRSAAQMIACRALLGIADATIAPSTLALIRNIFRDPAALTRAIAIWGASFSVGAVLGPLVGGLLLQHFRWGSVFLINVPVMLLVLALGPALLVESRDSNAGRIDSARSGERGSPSAGMWLAGGGARPFRSRGGRRCCAPRSGPRRREPRDLQGARAAGRPLSTPGQEAPRRGHCYPARRGGERAMPIYEFRCQGCGDEFELLLRRDETAVKCPECSSADVVRKFSAFAVGSGSSTRDRPVSSSAGGSSCAGCSGGHCSTCH